MAARHLQRLRQSDALSPAAAPDSASDSEPSPVTKPFNPFDLLSDEVQYVLCPIVLGGTVLSVVEFRLQIS